MRSCARPSRTRWSWTRCSRPTLLNEQSGPGAAGANSAKCGHRQLRSFLQLARGHRLSAFYHLAAYAGARRGELLFLRWDHTNLD
jgi:integrase